MTQRPVTQRPVTQRPVTQRPVTQRPARERQFFSPAGGEYTMCKVVRRTDVRRFARDSAYPQVVSA